MCRLSDLSDKMDIKRRMSEKERNMASASYAMLSMDSQGRRHAIKEDAVRTAFARDRDRIMYSSAFYRLAGKTQVFLSPRNPLISNRLTHTLQVAQIARTVARAIDANEDLAEAIALGHDLGHPPFGHKGERHLDQLMKEHGHGGFRHNVHSLHVVDWCENGGAGLNLSYEVREGILCHDGDVPGGHIVPDLTRTGKDPAEFTPEEVGRPAGTLEGAIVRLSDKIAYTGKDLEDAISAGIISRDDPPSRIRSILGRTNGEIIGTLVRDVIVNFYRDLEEFLSRTGRQPGRGEIGVRLSDEIKDAMDELIFEFNYPRIYESEANRYYDRQTERIIKGLFTTLLLELRGMKAPLRDGILPVTTDDVDPEALGMTVSEMEQRLRELPPSPERRRLERTRVWLLRRATGSRDYTQASILWHLAQMSDDYLRAHTSAELVRDYVASLTDKMAIDIYEALHIPRSVV